MNLLSPDSLYSHYLLELYLQKLSTVLLPHPFAYPPKLLLPQRPLGLGLGLGPGVVGVGAGIGVGAGVVKREEGALKREEGEEGNNRIGEEWHMTEGSSGRTMGTVVEDAHLSNHKVSNLT